MTHKEQVTSSRLSKKLKKLGVPQESLFAWYKIFVGVAKKDDKEHFEDDVLLRAHSRSTDKELYAALTVAELGLLLKGVPSPS